MNPVMTVHIADVGPPAALAVLRGAPRPAAVPGLLFAETSAAAPFARGVVPKPGPARVALVAMWEDDAAIDAFLAGGHPVLGRLADGWSVRLEPLRQTGVVAAMPRLVEAEQPVDPDEPVAVLTYGHTHLRKLKPFLTANQGASVDALDSPALLAATGLARPPRLVATFSLWRTAREMQDYAYQQAGHVAAMRENRRVDFHREALFARFRPYASTGTWDGRDPLAAGRAASASAAAPASA